MYTSLAPHGPLKLYHFVIMVAVVLAFLSQLPSFHSLRHINFVSLLLSLGYTVLVAAACVRAGNVTLNPSLCLCANCAYRLHCHCQITVPFV
jgi:hypothetical protein